MNKYEVMYTIKCQLEEIDKSLKHMQMILKMAEKRDDIYYTIHATETIKHLNIAKHGLRQELECLEQSNENALNQ